ncbi:hypothetical protein EFA46_009235 [Halarchaeum sp. CBA1220]|uniref:DUF7524 family protein n=1 Tax=Halarchaeum sp. CBA1220 TaxID=1853682 RepID=UPI000F3A8579|nr:hypothetical protein [Halarchaeum sp. CBA1220]QLC34383.1 hypothetical protein EFA46_009235 [Halarchaeum sp. CBA1220]
MSRTLTVHLNRERIHGLDADPTALEVERSFAVDLVNHGTASHVHVHLDDDLSRVASVGDGNHYVAKDATETVPVSVAPDGPRPVEGTLDVVAGYGAERIEIPVRVTEATEPQGVDVDESLAEVQRTDDEASLADRLRPAVPATVAVVGVLCAVLALLFVNGYAALALALVAAACTAGSWYAVR